MESIITFGLTVAALTPPSIAVFAFSAIAYRAEIRANSAQVLAASAWELR